MIDILNQWTRAVVYHSETAQTIAQAALEAYQNQQHLSNADLRNADLRNADLSNADLSGADLRGPFLSGSEGLLGDIQPFQISGTCHWIIVYKPGWICIGCEHHEVTWWETHYQAVGRREKYTDQQVEEYRRHIEYCKSWMQMYGVLEEKQEVEA